MKYGFVFVCQEGILEVQSAILAASLRKNIIGNYDITVGIPNFGKVSQSIIDFFKKIKANIVSFKNDFTPFYAEGNKILASNIKQNVDKKIFLDSDNICIKELNLNIFDNIDFYCLVADPYIALSEIEWNAVYNYFDMRLPNYEKLNNIHTQAVFVLFEDSKYFSNKWLKNALSLNEAMHKGKINLKRKRQIDQLSLGISLRSHHFVNYKVDSPMSWDGSEIWWHRERCFCHPWEKKKFIGERLVSDIVATPDMIFGYKKGKSFSMKMPYFLTVQNGVNFCEVHQGKPPFYPENWIDHYPLLKKTISDIVSKNLEIKDSKYWEFYQNRYLKNFDKIWFSPNRNIGNYIPRYEQIKLI